MSDLPLIALKLFTGAAGVANNDIPLSGKDGFVKHEITKCNNRVYLGQVLGKAKQTRNEYCKEL